jgi:DNA helicase II / ATP-dependent DNA helicase PcrA
MSYLDELNTVQRAAVTNTEGPALIIAGPGSGKTRVLTFRIAHLLQQGVAPWEILTLTFTNKAAKEMKERIEKVVGAKAHQVWAGTFHSIFARILRAEATKIGFPSNFSIYDSDDSGSLIRTIIKEMSLDPTTYNANAIRARISSAKSNLITPKGYAQKEDWMAEDRAAKRPYLHTIYEKYVARCKRAGAMDFDDLLFRLYELLRLNPENVREKYQKKFKYLLVDEFQDTNFLQYAILRYLVQYEGSPRNVAVVGDDAQSIYAFRGATIDNILDFEKDYDDLKVFKLEQNYRSTHHIVQAANEVISHNKRQIKKSIFTDKEDRNKIKLLKCTSDDEEARRVADLILEQKNRNHLHNSDFAILYRTNAQSRKFEENLRKFNLAYKVFGGMSFYQRKEVKDLVAYLRVVANPTDEEALRRSINFPPRGIGESTIDKISQIAGEREITMWEAMTMVDVSERTKKSIAGYRHLIGDWNKRVPTENALKLATEIVRRSGLNDLLKADTSPEGISRMENVNAVLDAIGEFVDTVPVDTGDVDNPDSDRSLAAYIQTITLLTDSDGDSNDRDFVTLMSVHAAKGLEFKSIFVTGMEEQLFPSFMSFSDPNGMDEERRLFYVAITRAKEFLTLTYAQNRYRFGKSKACDASRFLTEINQEHFEVLTGIGSARSSTSAEFAQTRSGVSGNFSTPKSRVPAAPPLTAAEIAAFTPSPVELILVGSVVRHLKFGVGKILSIEGPKDSKVACIKFKDDEMAERRIILKYTKLQVV